MSLGFQEILLPRYIPNYHSMSQVLIYRIYSSISRTFLYLNPPSKAGVRPIQEVKLYQGQRVWLSALHVSVAIVLQYTILQCPIQPLCISNKGITRVFLVVLLAIDERK